MVRKVDKNPLHDGVRNLTGIKKVFTSNTISIHEIREASKYF